MWVVDSSVCESECPESKILAELGWKIKIVEIFLVQLVHMCNCYVDKSGMNLLQAPVKVTYNVDCSYIDRIVHFMSC